MSESTIAPPASELIALERIDEPELVMRETMSDAGLESLVASLKALGQLQDLVVVRAGDRYRIAAGHRRRVALERAGFTHARCLVFPEGTPLEEAIKVAENEEREDVNPAARATYYRWLLDHQFNGAVEPLAAFVRRPLSGVQDALDLTQGDPAVLDALREPWQRKPDSSLAAVFPDHDLTRLPKITLAVARELNKVREDSYRRLFLLDALTQGVNSATVRKWRQERARDRRLQQATATLGETAAASSSEAPLINIDECPLCQSAADPHDMEYIRVHRSCRAVFARQQTEGPRT